MLRAGVIGSGPAAEAHARAFAALADRCLLAEPDDAIGALLQDVDVVAVASPPEDRLNHVRSALAAGCDVLVEPLATCSPDELAALRPAMAGSSRPPLVAIGHHRHFHPAVRELRRALDGHTLVALHTARVEPWHTGSEEHDRVMDLVLDDVQLVQSLARRTIAATQAAGRRLRRGGPLEHAVATLVFEDDLIVTLSAGRAGAERVHWLRAMTSDGEVVANLLGGVVEIRRTTVSADGRRESTVQRITPAGTDAHVAQAEAFLRAVEQRTPPEIGLGVGLLVLETTATIAKRIEMLANRPALRAAPAA